MDNQVFQKPADLKQTPKPTVSEDVVHVMPKEYRGGVAATIRKQAAPQPAPIRVEQPKPVVPIAPTQQSAVAVKMVAKPHHSALFFIAIIVGIILLAIAGGVGYSMYKQSQQVAQVPQQTPPIVTPPVTTPTQPVVVPDAPVTGGMDSDSDGLSDVEELRLYTTLVFNPDSDNDSFLDGNEVFHLYDPTKPNFARLADSSLVKAYRDPAGEYSLYLPVSFMSAQGTGDAQVTWSIPSGENISITRYSSPSMTVQTSGQSDASALQAWFTAQFPTRSSELMLPFTTKTGINGIQSQSRMETYLQGPGAVYKVEYMLGGVKTIEYRRTFEMMLNSFMYGV